MLMIDHGFDVLAVAAETNEDIVLLRELLKRPAVSVAIERWHKFRRLPTAGNWQWTKTDE